MPSDATSCPDVEPGDPQAPEASNSDSGISPVMASFIAQTVQAALAAERANTQASSLVISSPSTSVVSSLASPPVSSTVPVASGCSGGIPQSGI